VVIWLAEVAMEVRRNMPPLMEHQVSGLSPRNTRFRISAIDELARSVGEQLNCKLLQARERRTFMARADYFKLPQTELWFCSYDIPVSLLFSEGDFFRVQFRSAGQGATEVDGATIPVTQSAGCITTRNATIHFEAGFEQVVWRIPSDVVVKKLAVLTGMPVTNDVVFNPVLDLSRSNYDTLSSLLACVIGKIQAATTQPNKLVLAELEQAMLVSLLCQSDHNWRANLDGNVSSIVPWQVRRVEEYLAEHWRQPLDISALAAQTGASVRSIFRSFQQFRGYTPGEFFRQQRLIHAKDLLLDPHADHSIAAVAAACGFNDASHFAKEFHEAFGETPSAMRRRR
jgi:AraC-like DNA-binding protein